MRQAQLFDQLVELFLTDGFASLTIDALAARLRCSKSTLYALAGTRDELVRAVVVHFFRRATERVEARLAEAEGPRARLVAYLEAVAEQLKPASAAFFDDVAASPAAREIYERNTAAAARRVEQLVAEGVESGAFRPVHVGFVGDLLSAEMVRIQRRQVARATGLDDSAAYAELAALVVDGLAPRS
ncbi:transcriptional regulator, TetR family [Pseudonocardia thermophila]|uniref:Transcriptional regulator, TetR family n=1 Tax=Pseudonocardia thermophila TaxID=1848 RepID=A0A1M6XAS3_PSETH|nr:transcriptional regulator, TetR family [Pseudonocardia thermophila]